MPPQPSTSSVFRLPSSVFRLPSSVYRLPSSLPLDTFQHVSPQPAEKHGIVRARSEVTLFIGHFGVGFAAKKAAPQVSLGTLILAAELVDLLFPLFVLLGLEALRVDPGNTKVAPFEFYRYPFTHSLATGIGWAFVLALGYFALRRNGRGAAVVGLAVVSHWVLDWISHRPDMPMWPRGPKVGLGLWNSVAATVAVEGAIFVVGVALYVSATRARDRIGVWALWSLIGFLVLLYAANLAGPPPADAHPFEWAGLAAWLFVPWGYWIDRHRVATGSVANAG
jgi:membrane-bound metal-dependent hydrolase YbcI (DUF457 family)